MTATICKSAGATADDMAAINRFSRRELDPGEVFVFSLVLCDNSIDRDFERFPLASLKELEPLFVGKTGIFDHEHKGSNQTARIFETAVVQHPDGEPIEGEPYSCLTAKAYMVRSPRTEELILEIDAGIKKEVSIGCAMGEVVCSICGANRLKESCSHTPGKRYEGTLCHNELCHPSDAYEWSFVAVPAQPGAGITKSCSTHGHNSGEDLAKRLHQGGRLSLSPDECSALATYIGELEELSAIGRDWRADMEKQVVRMTAMEMTDLDCATIRSVVSKMDIEELRRYKDCYHARSGSQAPRLQLFSPAPAGPNDSQAFNI